MVRRVLVLAGILTAVIAFTTAAQSVRITIVDVGQGDGILIRTPNAKWVLIDAGPTRLLADSLGPQFGVNRLALVVTPPQRPLRHNRADPA